MKRNNHLEVPVSDVCRKLSVSISFALVLKLFWSRVFFVLKLGINKLLFISVLPSLWNRICSAELAFLCRGRDHFLPFFSRLAWDNRWLFNKMSFFFFLLWKSDVLLLRSGTANYRWEKSWFATFNSANKSTFPHYCIRVIKDLIISTLFLRNQIMYVNCPPLLWRRRSEVQIRAVMNSKRFLLQLETERGATVAEFIQNWPTIQK